MAANISSPAPGERPNLLFGKAPRNLECVFVPLALLMMALLAIGSFRQESPTFDEVAHIPSGLSYWQQHDTRLNVEHPPLLKMFAALPLLFTDVRANYSDPSWCNTGGSECEWLFGIRFFSEWNRNLDGTSNVRKLIFLTRLPMLLLLLLLGWIVYRISRTLAGAAGGLLSLVVFVTCPLFLGYGPLVITDIGLCLFVVLSAWSFADLWEQPNLRNLAAFAISTSAAFLSKFSALLIAPSVLLFLLWTWFRSTRSDPKSSHPYTSRLVYLPGAGAGVFAICYGFYWLTCSHTSPSELAKAQLNLITSYRAPERVLLFTNRFLDAHPAWADPLKPLWLYLIGIGHLNAGLNRPTYLLGKRLWHGVWYYFPVVSFFKLPPGLLGLTALLMICALIYLSRKRAGTLLIASQNSSRLRALLSFLIVFTLAAIRSKLNIGIRHFSVPITIVIILIGLLVPLAQALFAGTRRRMVYALCIALAFSCAITAVSAYPHYISYYNWFRLGVPKQEIVAESNLDWGQSLPEIQRFVSEHQITKLYLDSRMASVDASLYVPGAQRWACDNPDPEARQWVIVSADFVLKQPPSCGGLMRYEHWAIADGTMFVFRVTDDTYARETLAIRKKYLDSLAPPAPVNKHP